MLFLNREQLPISLHFSHCAPRLLPSGCSYYCFPIGRAGRAGEKEEEMKEEMKGEMEEMEEMGDIGEWEEK